MGNNLSYISQNKEMNTQTIQESQEMNTQTIQESQEMNTQTIQESQEIKTNTTPTFNTPSSSPYDEKKSAFKPYKNSQSDNSLNNFINIINEELNNCEKKLNIELEKNNIDPTVITQEQKNELKEKITIDYVYYLIANNNIMYWNFDDVNIAYMFTCENSPDIKNLSENNQNKIFYWLQDAINRVKEGKSIPLNNNRCKLFSDLCVKWKIKNIDYYESINHLNPEQKKILSYMMAKANIELFEHHDKLGNFKFEKNGYVAYANIEFIGIYDSIEEILENNKGITIFEIFIKNFANEEIDFIK